jgi:glucose-6-phosphate 1-epimerase
MQPSVQELAASYSVPGLRFEIGHGGLVKAVIETPASKGEIYLQGAHVTGFQLSGQTPLLWMSDKSLFESGKAIRGGVPICFPWFGPNALDPKAPSHGYARLQAWDIVDASLSDDDGVTIDLQTRINGFELNYRVSMGRILQLVLRVTLLENAPGAAKFEEALHTYFAVSDIHQVTIEGLETNAHLDKVDGAKVKPATGEPIRFDGECDRVYLETTATCLLHDPALKRLVMVSKRESTSTVIWNPWTEKSARMPDFGDDEWRGMVCIETANVGTGAIELQPGESHEMTAQISATTYPDELIGD